MLFCFSATFDKNIIDVNQTSVTLKLRLSNYLFVLGNRYTIYCCAIAILSTYARCEAITGSRRFVLNMASHLWWLHLCCHHRPDV